MNAVEQRIAWHVEQAVRSTDGRKFEKRMAKRAIKLARDEYRRTA